MKKSKLIMLISAIMCAVGIVGVVMIKFIQPSHKHKWQDAKIYYVSQDGVYYTNECSCHNVQTHQTDAGLLDVMMTTRANDRIVLTEDIVLTNTMNISSVVSNDFGPTGIDLNINLDLNGHKISTDLSSGDVMIAFNASYGSIKFSVKDGTLYSDDAKYIFDFTNSSITNSKSKNIILNINNVDCIADANYAAPIYANDTAKDIEINAYNSRFVAHRTGSTINNGVGAFINSKDSQFNFVGCEFEGGDGIYVKQGKVKLEDCYIYGSLTPRDMQVTSNPFYPIGSAITANSHNTGSEYSLFNIEVDNCVVKSAGSGMIKVVQTTATTTTGFNNDSKIEVKSAEFWQDPRINNYTNAQNVSVIQYDGNFSTQLVDGHYWHVVD